MEVLALNSKVKIGGGQIDATVHMWKFGDAGLQYLCVWWDVNQRQEEWIFASEVTPCERPQTEHIGFKGGAVEIEDVRRRGDVPRRFIR